MFDKPISIKTTLMAAVRTIELSARRIAVVVDDNSHVLGTVTDGDIRRHILAGGSLKTIVSKVMNPSPVKVIEGSSEGYIKDLMRHNNVIALPLVDKNGIFLRLIHLMDLENPNKKNSGHLDFSFAVIMAGGEGARLRPVTESIPKPMVKIGGVPLLQRQVERLAKSGIQKLYISINYLSHIIENHFGNGNDYGIEIFYLREEEKLGTAGALSLLPEKPSKSIILINGDILTTFDFESFYSFHISNKAKVTIASIDHRVDIPYGVIYSKGSIVKKLIEKPSKRFLCNAGIYAISPEALELMPKDKFSNMTDLINNCLSKKISVAVFPMYEYWSDIGTIDDLQNARDYFQRTEIIK